MPALLVPALLAALLAPLALLLAARDRRADAGVEALTQGLTTALAGVVVMLSLVARVSLRAGALLWVAASLVALVLWWRGGRRVALAPGDGLLVLVLGVIAAPHLLMTLRHALPPGGDPSFHLVLARLVQQSGGLVHDWRPFEDLALNYPLGSHAVLAALGDLGGMKLHAIFGPLLALLCVLAAAQAHALVVRAGGTRLHGCCAALALGTWAAWGSIDVPRWGGLPNEMALCFLLCAVTALAATDAAPRDTAAAAVALAAVVATHHHVALTTALLLLPCFAWVALVRRAATRARRMAAAGAGAIILALPSVLEQLLKARHVSGTRVLHVVDSIPPLAELPAAVGPVLVVMALAGAVLLARDPRGLRQARCFVALPAFLLLLLFAACGPAYSAWMGDRFGAPVTLMTASRFLTDAAPFLAVLAGLSLQRLGERLRARDAVVVAAGLVLALPGLGAWRPQLEPGPEPGFVRACAFVQESLPEDAYVFTGEPWATYLCWRRTGRTPMPVSEPATFAPRRGEINSMIRDGVRPEELAHAVIVRLGPPGSARANERVLYDASGGWAVIEMLTNP